jgi:hypothetical protein
MSVKGKILGAEARWLMGRVREARIPGVLACDAEWLIRRLELRIRKVRASE